MTGPSDRDDEAGAEFTHDEERNATIDGGGDGDADDRSGPLGDLAATVDDTDGTDRSQSSAADFDDLFDQQEGAEVDSDRLWEQLEAGEPDETGEPDEIGELDGSDEGLWTTDREIREVAKRSYCQKCEHFTDPPDVACTRDGTAILSVPTAETFRVADCPFVLEDEALEGRD